MTLGIIPLIWPIGAALAAGAGLWFNSQQTEKERLETEQARIDLERTKIAATSPAPIFPGAHAGASEALLPAAGVLAAVSAFLILRSR